MEQNQENKLNTLLENNIFSAAIQKQDHIIIEYIWCQTQRFHIGWCTVQDSGESIKN